MTRIRFVLPACAALLAGCQPPAGPDVTQVIAPSVITLKEGPAPADTEDQCWVHLPGQPRTKLEEQVIKVAEPRLDSDGRELSPAIYRRAQVEVTEPNPGQHFARLCDDQLTPAFVETLQRALQARGVYTGEVTGVMDTATREAVGRYQRGQDLDSDVLSLSAARQLGLVNVDIPRPEPPPDPELALEDPAPEEDPEQDSEPETDG